MGSTYEWISHLLESMLFDLLDELKRFSMGAGMGMSENEVTVPRSAMDLFFRVCILCLTSSWSSSFLVTSKSCFKGLDSVEKSEVDSGRLAQLRL